MDTTKKMYRTVNKLIDDMGASVEPAKESKGLLNRTSRGVSRSDNLTNDGEPLMIVIDYVKEFRKLREGLKNE
tara:strand:+ start:447 stop:665 length:219 start_codon:yes stop_codon:yes gene_type:complete